MKLTLNGAEYSADLMSLYRVSITEARTIKRQTGMTLADWRIGLLTFNREDPDMIAGVVYLLKHRAAEIVDWTEIGELDAQAVIDSALMETADVELINRVQGGGAGPEPDAGEGSASGDAEASADSQTEPAGSSSKAEASKNGAAPRSRTRKPRAAKPAA